MKNSGKMRQKNRRKKVVKKQRKALQIESLPVIHYFVEPCVAPRCKKIVYLIVRCPEEQDGLPKYTNYKSKMKDNVDPVPNEEVAVVTEDEDMVKLQNVTSALAFTDKDFFS
ncbi:hypothetical protein TURU_098479 [Turdus rufiventris]|nr:hypothetical protein TURU_098479 [Turdus rufiventris]